MNGVGSLPQPNIDPVEESRRLKTLKLLDLPDRARGKNDILQAICVLLSELLENESTLCSVVTSEYVDFLASYGTTVQCVPKRCSLFTYLTPSERIQAFVVEDIHADGRFRDFTWVKENSSRFYAAVPLLSSNGVCIGLMTLVDPTPCKRPAEDYNLLASFAELAIRELELGYYERLEGTLTGEARMLRDPDDVNEPVFLCEVTSRWWAITFANRAARSLTPLMELPEPHFWGVFQPMDGAKNLAQKLAYAEIEQGNEFTLQVKARERSKSDKDKLTICFQSALRAPLSSPRATIAIPNDVSTAEQMCCRVKHSHYFGRVVQPGCTRPEPRLLGSAQTFLSREFRTGSSSGRLQSDTSKGMSNVKLGIVCSSSPSARIYRGVWSRQPVSVKVTSKRLNQCVTSSQYGSAMIPKEAALSAELAHPNVIRTYKIVVQPKIADETGAGYRKGDEVVEASIVREWCGSGDLQVVTRRGGLRSEDDVPDVQLVLAIAIGIASGMEYLHIHNIIHGGLHPTSILLVEEHRPPQKLFRAKIAGFSRAEVSSKPVNSATHVGEDPVYSAPELFVKGVLSNASDVYAFGKILCFMHSNGTLRPTTVEAKSWWKGDKGDKSDAPPIPAGMHPVFEALARECLLLKPQARPDFTTIKERLVSLANGSNLEICAEEQHLSAVDLLQSSSSFKSMTRRQGARQARTAVENIARISSNVGRKFSRKETDGGRAPSTAAADAREVLAFQPGIKQTDTKPSAKSQQGTSAIFGKKIRGLMRFPHHQAAS